MTIAETDPTLKRRDGLPATEQTAQIDASQAPEGHTIRVVDADDLGLGLDESQRELLESLVNRFDDAEWMDAGSAGLVGDEAKAFAELMEALRDNGLAGRDKSHNKYMFSDGLWEVVRTITIESDASLPESPEPATQSKRVLDPKVAAMMASLMGMSSTIEERDAAKAAAAEAKKLGINGSGKSGSPLGSTVISSALDDSEDKDWQERASCVGVDPDLFFPERGASTKEAKGVCNSCEVRMECLEYALRNGEKFGIWGGMSERERRRLRRQRALARRAASASD